MVMTCQIVSFTRRTDSYGTYVNTCIDMKNKNIYWEFLNTGGLSKGENDKCFNFCLQKYTLPNPQTITAGEGVERREPSYTAGGDVKWYSHYREHYGGSLKN